LLARCRGSTWGRRIGWCRYARSADFGDEVPGAARDRPCRQRTAAADYPRTDQKLRDPQGGEPVKAVEGISLQIGTGECLGLVGESGCGKTTLSKMLLRAVTPDAGQVHFRDGDTEIDVLALEGKDLTRFRRRVQYVFQDPFSALNPRMNVFDILAEPLLVHGIGDAAERRARVEELVQLVGSTATS